MKMDWKWVISTAIVAFSLFGGIVYRNAVSAQQLIDTTNCIKKIELDIKDVKSESDKTKTEQIATNKELTGAITDLKVAIGMLSTELRLLRE